MSHTPPRGRSRKPSKKKNRRPTRAAPQPTKVIRAKDPVDVLAMVPCLMGFHPEDSVVLVTVGNAAHPLHARMDLPTDADEALFTAEYLTNVAVRNDVRCAVVVVYTDDECLGEEAGSALGKTLAAAGIAVPLAIRADGSRWWCLLEDCDRPQCRPDGTPYDISGHPLIADAVLDGRVLLRSREELRDSLVGNDPEDSEAVSRAADDALDVFQHAVRHPLGPAAPAAARAHLVQEGQWLVERVRRFVCDGERLTAEEVGRLLVSVISIEVRDVAWAEMTRQNASRHVDLWRDVVRRAPGDLLAAPAALLGFAAWLSGDGALAWCAVDRCQEADPDYTMAGLLSDALTRAVPPSTWRPLDRELLSLFAG